VDAPDQRCDVLPLLEHLRRQEVRWSLVSRHGLFVKANPTGLSNPGIKQPHAAQARPSELTAQSAHAHQGDRVDRVDRVSASTPAAGRGACRE
jgi:hypothetical protein